MPLFKRAENDNESDNKKSEIDYNANARENQERFKSANFDDLKQLEADLMNVSNLAGLFYPENRLSNGYVVWQMNREEAEKPLAERVPPTALRHYYGVKNNRYYDDLYLQSGATDIRILKKVTDNDGFTIMGERVLEFGCSAGRMMRHLEAEAQVNEVWGADLHSAAIHWAQSHLSPPFHFCTTTTAPHLPFEDNYFGLIFAGSVWTHIGELDDAWLLEMRRVLRPGGRIYITISDQNTVERIRNESPEHASNQHVDELDAETGMLNKPYLQFVTRTTPWLQRCVYDQQAWLEKVGRWLKVKEVRENAYGWQTGVLFEKTDKVE